MGLFNWGLPFFAGFFWLIIPLIVWEAVWKGIALWRAAKNSHLIWFIAILVINSAGILPIIYVLAFSQKGNKNPQPEGKV